MKAKNLGIWISCLLSLVTVFAPTSQPSPAPSQAAVAITVNCDAGQSLNNALSQLDKNTPATVFVQGTCTEYVTINGFEGLTVKGLPGATLVQPSTIPAGGLAVSLLRIDASRSVLIDSINIQSSTASGVPAIGIGKNSIDVRLRNLTVVGELKSSRAARSLSLGSPCATRGSRASASSTSPMCTSRTLCSKTLRILRFTSAFL